MVDSQDPEVTPDSHDPNVQDPDSHDPNPQDTHDAQDPDNLEFQWADPRDYVRPEGFVEKMTGSAGGSALGAAMVAVGEILEPEKTRVVFQQEDDEPEPDLPFTMDFGHLPPLN